MSEDQPGEAGFASGRAARFAELLGTCQRPVFLYAMSLLHHAPDAEEVLQETNLVLWRKFDQFEEGTNFVKWACGVAHHEVMKLRQRQDRQRRLLSDEVLGLLASESRKSLEGLEARRMALAQCMEKLSPGDRQLVLRRYEPGGSTREIAETLGRSIQGTRKSLHRIRLALLACIERRLAAEIAG